MGRVNFYIHPNDDPEEATEFWHTSMLSLNCGGTECRTDKESFVNWHGHGTAA